MKPVTFKEENQMFITRAGRSARIRKLLLISFLSAVILIYVLLIRPALKPLTGTVVIELAIFGAVLLALIVSLMIFAVFSVIMPAAKLFSSKKERLPAMRRRVKKWAKMSIWLAAVLLILVFASQLLAYTPPIIESGGSQAEDSIAIIEKVRLNGAEQWISIRSRHKENPVLLFLAGGPGGSQLAAVRSELRELEEHFVVVGWDQPGSAKSFGAVPRSALTRERYIADGCELAKYLCDRFRREKIFLVGESWGSALGIWMVQRQPELFYAFAGTGQMVSFLDTELYCYDLAVKTAQERGDAAVLKKLREQGSPPYYGDGVALKMANYLLYLFKVMSSNPAIAYSAHNTLQDLAAPEYGLLDKINYIRGLTDTLSVVYPQLYDMDLRRQAAVLEVPVYILEGRHDINAPTALAQEYYEMLRAPEKEIIWFERSGHTPWVDENERFAKVLADRFLSKINNP
ncbi:MAG: putative aminoacrylate hydrolase RutD [Firmicutes bacterium ADurb.Bin182]|nr:MAG: putative aminoacrylate hydrolase RutD [Firmicutes bacterium ADurb.Bin182]